MKAGTVKKCKILIGCFSIQLLIAGAVRLSSIYFVESITSFNIDRRQASFPFVLTYMMKNLTGPVIGYLEQIIGMKWIITIGCVMATIAIGGCFFAEDIIVITILWGVMLGISQGFSNNMQTALINRHFNKSKNRAMGLVLVGSSIGGFLLPSIAMACIQTFGTSGSFLLLSAIVAHSIPASLLLENPITNSNNIPKRNAEVLKRIYNKDDKTSTIISNTADYLCMEQTHKILSASTAYEVSSEDLNISNASLNNVPEERKPHINESNELSKHNLPFSTCFRKVPEQCKKKELVFNKRNFSFRNFRVFIDPAFIVILIINGINMVIVAAVWTIILDFVRDKNVPESLEIYYVMLLPLTDILGRLGSGYIADKNFLTSSSLCFIFFFIMSMTLIFVIHVNDFILLMACESLLSICIGITLVLTNTIADDFVEESLKTMAQSSRFILYAPLSLTISPMLGYFRGGYGSYDNVFYILSGASLFCACSACLLPHLARRRQIMKNTHA